MEQVFYNIFEFNHVTGFSPVFELIFLTGVRTHIFDKPFHSIQTH